jgi:hypothetical protein
MGRSSKRCWRDEIRSRTIHESASHSSSALARSRTRLPGTDVGRTPARRICDGRVGRACDDKQHRVKPNRPVRQIHRQYVHAHQKRTHGVPFVCAVMCARSDRIHAVQSGTPTWVSHRPDESGHYERRVPDSWTLRQLRDQSPLSRQPLIRGQVQPNSNSHGPRENCQMW